MSNRIAIPLLATMLAWAGAAAGAAERVKCRTTADNWVETPPWEPHARDSANHGSDDRLTMSGRNSFVLLAFDMTPARGLRIEKAVLRVHRKPDPVALTM